MPGDDDDDTTTTGNHPGGSFGYWLNYKVWGIPGWVIVLVVFLAGLAIGHSL